MPFVRASAAPERMMLWGLAGSGKSSAAFSIARKFAATNTPARVHLIDTDNAFYDMIDEYPEAEGIVLPLFVDQSEEGQEWNELEDAINKALKDADATRGDWIVVDRAEPSWEWIQDHWARKAKKQSIDELRAEGRDKVASGKDKNLRAGMSGFEWGEVKTKFRKPYNRLMVSGCNIIITTGLTKISQYTDTTGEKSDAVGGLPWGPAGGAGSMLLLHMVRDGICLRCTNIKKGEYFASTAKGRGRTKRLDNTPIKDFCHDVLFKQWGWRVRGNGGDHEE